MGGKQSRLNGVDIIVLLGPTGAGKSSFINEALGRPVCEIGKSLSSCTANVQTVECSAPGSGRKVVLVDTPAFNHATLPMPKVEKMISQKLKKVYKKKIEVTGIVYLHRITDVRLNENPILHLDSFISLCGEHPTGRIVLATTMWGLIKGHEGSRREAELADTCWKPFCAKGSRILRFQRTPASAWEIINAVLQSPS